MAFELPKLDYAYDALEPNIDAKTMEIHHSKHHNGYTSKLNSAISGSELEGKSIEEIMDNLDMSNSALRNNGGGYYNHSLFWKVISPIDKGELTGELKQAIMNEFGSLDGFKSTFSKAAATQFGSGWAWLCVKREVALRFAQLPIKITPLCLELVVAESQYLELMYGNMLTI